MSRQLLQGHSRFRSDVYPELKDEFRRLVDEGQSPGTLLIACADSRVVPDLITDSGPGDLFVLRNVGNLVPPPDDDVPHHGVSSGIDFAVDVLGVRDVVVCGHSRCGAIQALYDPPPGASDRLARWIELAAGARLEGPVDDDLLRRTERRSVGLQVERLLAYPNVRARVEAGELSLHGWHYVIEEGVVHVLDRDTGAFEPHG